MKQKFILTLYGILLIAVAYTQQPSPVIEEAEQQLENLTEANEAETEDDSWLQQMEQFRKRPLNLNAAQADELRELMILTDLQIQNFLAYRKLLGKLISVYELQAIPTWNLSIIKKLLPFITIANTDQVLESFMKRFKEGGHSLLFRYARVLEKSVGYIPKDTGNYYLGSPQKLFFRYRYQYKNLLQYGITGDKDAGEQFFRGRQQYGFDFYSFHLFARKIGIIKSLAIGDFTVNMGQGLIQWQSIAFRKGINISGVKRQSAILRPYTSAGEYNFHRGAGITIKRGNIEATAFVSFRKINANFTTDTVTAEDFFTSFLTSGYNRTQSELDKRNNLNQVAYGGNISWNANQFHVGINSISYRFSSPLQKRQEPYNLYALNGDNWNNSSIDYSYTFRNFHLFGEAAIDKNRDKAFVNGLLISVDPKVDLSIVHRSISKEYQSINGNAFTENTFPSNENGLYAGTTLRFLPGIRVDAYADFYKFPWLKYLVDAPSSGKDFFVQLTYSPNKQLELYTRYKTETKLINQTGNISVTNQLIPVAKYNWRTQISYQVSPGVLWRNRVELLCYHPRFGDNETGFLGFMDGIYNPPLKPYSGSLRLQYFETGGYNSRLYAYENDLLYSYSIPVFFDKGFRYYLNLNYKLNKHIHFWTKWSQNLFIDKGLQGSGLDEIKGNTKRELKLQVLIFL